MFIIIKLGVLVAKIFRKYDVISTNRYQASSKTVLGRNGPSGGNKHADNLLSQIIGLTCQVSALPLA
jgi:hypothetical protein